MRVTGFDTLASVTSPPLTTLRVRRGHGRACDRHLLDRSRRKEQYRHRSGLYTGSSPNWLYGLRPAQRYFRSGGDNGDKRQFAGRFGGASLCTELGYGPGKDVPGCRRSHRPGRRRDDAGEGVYLSEEARCARARQSARRKIERGLGVNINFFEMNSTMNPRGMHTTPGASSKAITPAERLRRVYGEQTILRLLALAGGIRALTAERASRCRLLPYRRFEHHDDWIR